VIAGGEDVAEEGEVFDFVHGLIFVGEFEEVEIGVGDHDVLGLAPYPSAHVDVAVGGAGARGIDVEADAGFSFFAIAAAAAGDVEGDGADVAFFDEFDIAAGFDDFAGDFVAEDESRGGGGPAADHVLIGAADVGGDDFEEDAVLDFLFAGGIEKFGEVDGLDFYFTRFDVSDAAIGSHGTSEALSFVETTWTRRGGQATAVGGAGQRAFLGGASDKTHGGCVRGPMMKVVTLNQRKICTLSQLLAIRDEARRGRKTLVHCHGCFDIVHPGHIHHLQFAKSQGDILVVTVSADPQVNKGAARPLVPEDLRAASLAALECVDWVFVNPHPTAVELISELRPDIYIKGKEYETNHDPRFLAERNGVTRHGGRVVFSSGDVIYSSTALIDQLTETDAFAAEKVRRYRDRYGLTNSALQSLVTRMQSKRVLVIGDYILDRYHFCEVVGVAGESPMMTLRPMQTTDYDGGAAIIASHLAQLGARPRLFTSLAEDGVSHEIRARLEANEIDVEAIAQRRQVVTKHRYLSDQTKLFKVDDGATAPLDSRTESDLAERILGAADKSDAAIFVDFGYGMLTQSLLERLMKPLREKLSTITADVSGMRTNLLAFRDVDLLCPTEREARQAMNDFSAGLNNVVHRLLDITSSKQAIITLGKQGLIAFDQFRRSQDNPNWDRNLRSEYLPALASTVVDALGCGDALLATATLALAAGGSLQAAALLGSCAAAMEIARLGNHPVSAEQLIAKVHLLPPPFEAARLAS